MRGFYYQRLAHRPIDFAPYVGSPGEAALAEARRNQREQKRREELDGTVYPAPTKAPMMNLSSEWGSEASYEVGARGEARISGRSSLIANCLWT